MTSKRWQPVEGLYQAALEHDRATRHRFLDEQCAGEPELRNEVASLLRHGAATHAFFDVPAVELAAPTGASALAPLAPGTSRVVKPIDAGGMGEVFLARDVRLKREVALKILPDRCRFDAERLVRYEDRGTIHYPESTF